MKNTSLICTKCGKKYPPDQVYPRCDSCNEPLEVEQVVQGKIRGGNALSQTILERYAEFLPFDEVDNRLSLHEGFTSLVSSPKLAADLNIKDIYFKNETQNPTWSFKDRGTVVGVQHAVSLGYKKIGTVSTGNMAVSVAAYGARAGLETYVLVNSSLPPEKLNPIAIYSPHLIKVEGDYGSLYYKSLEIGEKQGIYFINSDVPFRVEGSKTIAFELCEQFGFQVPDYVVVPTSAGGNIRGIIKGFEEFKACRIISKVPKFICAQAEGCSPIFTAYKGGRYEVSPFNNPETIAHAIENSFPPSGNEVLRRIRDNGGICEAVSDSEIIEAQRTLAGEGIFGQPASAVPLAVVKKLRQQGYLSEKDTVACIVTGSGLKFTSAFAMHDFKIHSCTLENISGLMESMI